MEIGVGPAKNLWNQESTVGGHGEGDFRKSMDAEKFAPAIPMKETSNTKVS